jgi:hypothetical protein
MIHETDNTGLCNVIVKALLTIFRSSLGPRWRRVAGDRQVNEPLTA